jgi:hypothetical protein
MYVCRNLHTVLMYVAVPSNNKQQACWSTQALNCTYRLHMCQCGALVVLAPPCLTCHGHHCSTRGSSFETHRLHFRGLGAQPPVADISDETSNSKRVGSPFSLGGGANKHPEVPELGHTQICTFYVVSWEAKQ